MKIQLIRTALLAWFAEHARYMPWRSEPTPWHVWVSEIMLQQTRVESVFEYFERFMKRFPSPEHLAQAPLEDLLDLWAGLGYYSRARNLHHACQEIMSEHGGEIPSTPEAFGALKGVGQYTCGAVLSIAFGRAQPIVDGNVERVFSRLFLIDSDIRSTPTKKILWGLAKEFVADLTPDQSPGDINQAIMELGALVCKPKRPSCEHCPLVTLCDAHANRVVEQLPKKKKPTPKKSVHLVATFSVDSQNRIWVVRRPEDGLLAGLWTLPMQPQSTADTFSLVRTPDVQIKHAFTHLVWSVDVYKDDQIRDVRAADWGPTARAMTVAELSRVALGGPSLKALIKLGVDLPKRRGSGQS